MNKRVNLLFAGDVVHNGPNKIEVDSSLKDLIKSADLFSINLEAPLKGIGMPITKVGPSLNQLESVVSELQKLGVNVISCANNHICDYGKDALVNTISTFSDFLVLGAGSSFEEAYKLKTLLVNGLNIGFLSFSECGYGAICDDGNTWGYAWINHKSVDKLIKESAMKTDILIVQVHAGVEEICIPLPEWRERYKELIDLGASAIIATHPHVPQGWEMYKNCPIFYSLGNFWFDYESNDPLWNKSILAKLSVNSGKEWFVESIPIERKKGLLSISSDVKYQSYIQRLNDYLEEPLYSVMVKNEVKSLWDNRYKHFYLSSLNGIEKFSLIRSLKILKRLLLKKGIQTDLLHHLLFIESHLWAVNRALKLRYQDNNEL